jgi:hypothetical protein
MFVRADSKPDPCSGNDFWQLDVLLAEPATEKKTRKPLTKNNSFFGSYS